MNEQIISKLPFIKKIYSYLGLGLAIFTILSFIIALSGLGLVMLKLYTGGITSLLVIGIFVAFSWLSNNLMVNQSKTIQLVGLGLYALVEAIIFSPLFYLVKNIDINILYIAIAITASLFLALTTIVMRTKVNLSFIGTFLTIAGIGVVIAVLASIIFGFALGIWFTAITIILACGYILYDTSNIIHKYQEGQEIAAAGALLGSVLYLLYQVIQFILQSRD
jgi:uncharacterized protein